MWYINDSARRPHFNRALSSLVADLYAHVSFFSVLRDGTGRESNPGRPHASEPDGPHPVQSDRERRHDRDAMHVAGLVRLDSNLPAAVQPAYLGSSLKRGYWETAAGSCLETQHSALHDATEGDGLPCSNTK